MGNEIITSEKAGELKQAYSEARTALRVAAVSFAIRNQVPVSQSEDAELERTLEGTQIVGVLSTDEAAEFTHREGPSTILPLDRRTIAVKVFEEEGGRQSDLTPIVEYAAAHEPKIAELYSAFRNARQNFAQACPSFHAANPKLFTT